MLGAVIAVLGWTGKQVLEWFFRLRAEQKSRRSRLLALLAIRRAAEAIWASQCKTRDKFVALVRSREEAFRGPTKPYDHLFSAAFPSMSPQEAELHEIVRSTTIHAIRPLNQATLQWLTSDADFRVHPHDESLMGRLAKYLTELEVHLVLWNAKFQAWIPDSPERALVYLADEQHHGVGFPLGGEDIIKAVLFQRGPRWPRFRRLPSESPKT